MFTPTFEEHMTVLKRLFHYIDIFNLSLRHDKCDFAKPELGFLGFIVNGKTIKLTAENVRKVKEFEAPKTQKQPQSFLGIANFNRRFIPNFSAIAKPLSSLTSAKVKFTWGNDQHLAFEKLKMHLCNAPNIYLADWSKEFHIQTDASKIAVGRVLFQRNEQSQKMPLAYFSQTLDKETHNWSATHREIIGIISASRKWAPYCSGKVVFHTDHEPLKIIRKQKYPKDQLCKWILELENFDYRVEYVKGKDNPEADYLSMIITDNDNTPKFIQEINSVYLEEVIIPTMDVILIKKHLNADPLLLDATKQHADNDKISKGYSNHIVALWLRMEFCGKGIGSLSLNLCKSTLYVSTMDSTIQEQKILCIL